MSTYLDLDDCAAENPEAKKELAAMRAEIELLRLLLGQARFDVRRNVASESPGIAIRSTALLAQIDDALKDER